MLLVLGGGISNSGVTRLLDEYLINYEQKELNEVTSYNYDLVIKSPGIRYNENLIIEFEKRNINIITDIEYVFKYIKKPIIGVTGSNGKTSTCTLIYHIIKDKYNVAICGNIGVSIADAFLDNQDADIFIVELSSFELKGCVDFHPFISVILNINPCHIDYHKTFTDYIESKENITINQRKTDYFVYNYSDFYLRKTANKTEAKKIAFSTKTALAKCYIFDNYIYYKKIKICNIKYIKNVNLDNVLACVIVSKILNIENKDIKKAIKTYSSPKFRLERLNSYIYNDSKSTNVYSGINAIKSFSNIFLICGGYDKSDNLNVLKNCLHNITCVFTYGETKDKFYNYFKNNNIEVYKFDNLSQAFNSSIKKRNNNIILFSPMCASYDQYESYIKRGEEFEKIFLSLDNI